ncbi:asparagine synthase (glutamine-hydrolyzing) [Agrobacterium rosae]|uniref:asparagine synthase (glutamine-hydrolyzing) n=1 Tax=Agrobacterium rosae TaxID=1972867 RepID=A0A1R3U8I3_9HYPH|nr:asparagine synthase (glutamine-hydrolyzing) [Agrobacterium rosae]SCX35132.1 Asparagine synthetase [glutamine-hydrolyzing] 1 [Agrobacterium rosae]
MCRLYGYVSCDTHQFDTRLPAVALAQIRGGPDQQNFYAYKTFGIGANRLAITDPDGGRQPYHLIENIYVVLNGEIYNHDDLRRTLEAKGHTFPDSCDGSILPAMYCEYGETFVEYLDGMFSVAVIDNRTGVPKLTIASDSTGMKPLYYASTLGNRSFIFATELPALLRFEGVPIDVANDLIDQYMTVRAVSDGRTFVKDVYSLSASSIMTVQAGKPPIISRYVSRIRYDAKIPDNLKDAGAAFRELLEWEIRRLVRADAKVCSVNSGGLDSSLITMLASRSGQTPLNSFHVFCEGEWPFDERAFAREVARKSGGDYHEAPINPQEIPDLIPTMVDHLGQPNGAPHALSAYRLFQKVSAEGYRVALTGEGSDELFCGYSRMVAALEDPTVDWTTNYLDGMSPCPQSIRYSLYKQDIRGTLMEARKGGKDAYSAELSSQHETRSALIRRFEQERNLCHYVLHRAEPLAMASAVEVRIPFCQPRVRDFSWRMNSDMNLANGGRGKAVVYEAAAGVLPNAVLNRQKQPFTLPVTSLMHRGSRLIEYCRDTVSSRQMRQDSPFDPIALQKVIDQQITSPSRDTAFTIWAVAIYATWLERLSRWTAVPT